MSWTAPLLVLPALAFVPSSAPLRGLTLSQQRPVRMVAASGEKKSFLGQVGKLNTMNKMTVIKKTAPKLRGKKLTPAMVELTGKFKKQYAAKELEVLWAALLKIYGSRELAEQAAQANPQVLNPSYSFCNTMLESERVLVDMMGKEEAMEVMLKNPAVLQCGPSLDTLGPDEIKGFANIRALGNRIPDSARGVAISAFFAFLLFPVIASNNPALQDSPLLQLSKPIVGTIFAILIEGSRIVIVGTILKSKVAGSEKEKAAIERAAASERRRMGKA